MRKTHPTRYMMAVKPILGRTPGGRIKYGPAVQLGIVSEVWITKDGAVSPPSGRMTYFGTEYTITHTYSVYQPEYPARPDVTFNITVSPVFHTRPCAEYWRQMTTGTRDWLHPHQCKECTRLFTGWEAWGENGHRQGGWSQRAHMVGGIAYLAKKQWRTVDGRLMGYHFRLGEAICYEGTPDTQEVSR